MKAQIIEADQIRQLREVIRTGSNQPAGGLALTEADVRRLVREEMVQSGRKVDHGAILWWGGLIGLPLLCLVIERWPELQRWPERVVAGLAATVGTQIGIEAIRAAEAESGLPLSSHGRQELLAGLKTQVTQGLRRFTRRVHRNNASPKLSRPLLTTLVLAQFRDGSISLISAHPQPGSGLSPVTSVLRLDHHSLDLYRLETEVEAVVFKKAAIEAFHYDQQAGLTVWVAECERRSLEGGGS